jgi:hypothetical protein
MHTSQRDNARFLAQVQCQCRASVGFSATAVQARIGRVGQYFLHLGKCYGVDHTPVNGVFLVVLSEVGGDKWV